MSSIIILEKNKSNHVEITKMLTTVGNNSEYDIQIKSLLGGGFSILKNAEKLKLIPIDEKTNKAIKGNWDKEFDSVEIFRMKKDLKIILLPEFFHDHESVFKDWNFEDLPKNPRNDKFPQKVLDFILNSIEASEGGLFLRKGELLTTIAKKNLKLKASAENLINKYLDTHRSKEVLRLNFETHSVLFMAGFRSCNFLLIRSDLEDEGEIILYVPEPDNKKRFPDGILCTLLYLTSQALSLHLAYLKNKKLLARRNSDFEDNYCWGHSPQMTRNKKIIDKLAMTDLSIIIHGETGSGKEGIAQYIAKKSGAKIVSVNCAAIPIELAESILFGHEKGAFTGAINSQKGRIEEADKGIFFLDEIGELNKDIQGKLLRVLQDGIFRPIGGKERKIKTRIIAATHERLEQMVDQKTFREDLFYRLNEAVIEIPPLRERREDIALLAGYFLEQTVNNNKLSPKYLSEKAIEFLKNQSWPGNIRELRSAIRKMAILTDEEIIERTNFHDRMNKARKNAGEYPMNLNDAKKIFINERVKAALSKVSGNKTQAAKLLEITPRSLFRILANDCDEKVIKSDNCVTGDQLRS